MQAIVLDRDLPPDLAETRRTLIDAARRRFGALPAELVADHVLEMAADADFPVREAALEALRRRWEFARRDELRVAARPAEGRVLGTYTTARSGRSRSTGGQPRPYTSVLESLDPLRASCDCADFLRSSLGLCKHLLVVLEHVFSNRRLRVLAAKEPPARTGKARLAWDPRLPLSGELDRLAGLRLVPAGSQSSGRAGSGASTLAALARAFPNASPDARLLGDPDGRCGLLRSLARAIEPERRARPLLAASPAARAIVREELERAERAARNRSAAAGVLSELRSLERRLYPYQREGVERFLGSGRLLLADDMGLGKTTQAIAACHALFRAGKIRRGLVIVPASLKPQWLREWQETTSVTAAIVDGTREERARLYRKPEADFLIIGYEQLLRDFEHVGHLAPDMVVLDEAQRIKNYATKSAAYVKALDPEYRLVLTGTPMENRLEELASILDWVDDLALAPKWRLVPWYTTWQGDGGATGRAGARNLDTLRSRISGCVVRRVRREVLAQLPSRTDTRVPIEMTPQQLDEHDALNQPIAKLIAIAKRRPLLQKEFLRLMQLLTQQRIIANGLGQLRFEELWPAYSRARPDAALLEGLFAPKLVELRRLIADLVLEQERKVVVFSQWRRMLRLADWSVRDVLEARGLRTVFFTGAEKPAQRTRSIVDFHDDPRVKVMFLSDAGGVGLNLQRAANACINLELPWNPAVLEQRIGRIYRLGQKQPIDVFNLVSESSIESRIAELVGTKQALFAGLFDGTSDEIRFDAAASFLTRVERLVDPGPLPEPPQAPASETLELTDAEDAELEADEVPSARALVLPNGSGESSANGSGAAHAASNSGAEHNPVAALFSALRVERTTDGGVRLEAPPEAAGSLIALFEGMAKLLSTSA
jgi:hypothetical protein